MAIHVQILTTPEARDTAIRACFEQTTTLGLRHAVVERAVLPRHMADESAPRVKIAARPSGRRTAKPESDDLADSAKDRQQREAARRRATLLALTGEAESE